MYMCICVYIYIYIFIGKERERERERETSLYIHSVGPEILDAPGMLDDFYSHPVG